MNLPLRQPRQQRIDRFADRLSAGRYDLLDVNFAIPMAVFLGDRQLLLNSQAEGSAFFGYFHAAMQSVGLRRLATRIVAQEIARRGRFRLWIEMHGCGPAGENVLLVRAILYYAATADGERIQMVEILHQRLPSLARLWPDGASGPREQAEDHHAQA